MKKVFACIDASAASDGVCDASAWIGSTAKIPIELLHVIEKPEFHAGTDLSGAIGLGSRELLLEELIELDAKRGKLAIEHGKNLLAAAEKRLSQSGAFELSSRQRHANLLETLVDLNEEIKAVVLGRRGELTEGQEAEVGSQVESILRTLHAPILVVTGDFKPPRKAMLAYDGSETADKTLELVANSDVLKNVPIEIVTVQKGETAEQLVGQLKKAHDKLADCGFICSTRVLEGGNVAQTLIKHQQGSLTDLIIMGAYGHSRIRQFILGSTTSSILRQAKCSLLVMR